MDHVEQIRKFNRFYANVLGKIDQEINNRPYSLIEARVISELHANPSAIAKNIREKLGIDRGYMSRIIHKFETGGLVEIQQSPTDKRQQLLQLTETGKAVFAELTAHANQEVAKMIEPIPKHNLATLTQAMEAIESVLEPDLVKNQVVIRPHGPGDVGYVAHLHGTLYGHTYQFGKVFEYYVLKGLTEFMKNTTGGELWIAEVNGHIAGSIAITKSADETAQIRWFILDEAHHGQGIGKQLMDTAMDFCREQDYRHVFLWTVNILGAARYLYGKYGFTLTEEKPNNEWTDQKLIEERWDMDLRD
ncbi:bifunctional helix-turn-helix transcriptional regulator/GNAT family N-acetyltransferase [Planococcus sp. YIM B11945]|uniref:bifunctional helix-turn-helix transcriptional regulator/GNAT family N-acetyltransferase n=1 Tax=Planococcus sp. YIM B11945 TaxID=3435410 RepID=UPI003D7C6A65